MFVNSHLKVLRQKAGEEALQELERRFGAPLYFGSLHKVPVRDEARILELMVDITDPRGLEGTARGEAAGVLHFESFIETSLGSALMRSLPHTPRSFKTLLHNARSIAKTLYSNTEFMCDAAEDGKSLSITITNCDYPLEHFKGFFEAWMRYWGLRDINVTAKTTPGAYCYTLSFKQ